MEVHAHTHTPRKKWTHYFWEFLMLFLAVFCGFLAENQREHFVEGKRERQFMKMMLEDLKRDTAELSRIGRVHYGISKNIDTALNFIYLENPSDNDVVHLYQIVPRCLTIIRADLQDRTSTQLKNAGNLRLIQKKNITDSLSNYWYLSEILQNTNQPIHEAERKLAKDIAYSLLNYHNYTNNNPSLGIRDDNPPKLVNTDFVIRVKLGNYLNSMRLQLTSKNIFVFNWTRMRMEQAANNLIELIKEEYHLD